LIINEYFWKRISEMTFLDRAHFCPWRGFVHERHEGHENFFEIKI